MNSGDQSSGLDLNPASIAAGASTTSVALDHQEERLYTPLEPLGPKNAHAEDYVASTQSPTHDGSLTSAVKPLSSSWHGAGVLEEVEGPGGSSRDTSWSGSFSGGGQTVAESSSAGILSSGVSPVHRQAFVGWPRAVVVHSELRTEAGFAGVLHE